jgi:hypothetical protein
MVRGVMMKDESDSDSDMDLSAMGIGLGGDLEEDEGTNFITNLNFNYITELLSQP